MLWFYFWKVGLLLLVLMAGLAPLVSKAHEVYVLTPDEVNRALATPSFNMLAVALGDLSAFTLWAFVVIFTIGIVFIASISSSLERMCDPALARIRRYAHPIARITIGLALILGAYYGAIFGPELPLSDIFGSFAGGATALIALGGFMIVLNFYTRIAALVGLVLYIALIFKEGLYLLTYLDYAGALFALVLMESRVKLPFGGVGRRLSKWIESLAPYRFLIIRVSLGCSLIVASLYAKILHNALALAVVEKYPALEAFFGFPPHFLILGAALIELLLGLFLIAGIEIRFVVLFIGFWLSLSLWYFAEALWPHIILIGIPLALFCYGYDRYSLEGRFFRHGRREPVL